MSTQVIVRCHRFGCHSRTGVVEYGPTERILTNPSDPRTEAYIEGRFG